MPFGNLTCLFLELLPPPSPPLGHGGPFSVLWVLLRGNGFLQQHPPWLGKRLAVRPLSCGRGYHWLGQPCAVLPWGRGSVGAIALLQRVEICIITPQRHAEIPLGRLDLFKVSFVVGFYANQRPLVFPRQQPRGVGADSLALAGFAV